LAGFVVEQTLSVYVAAAAPVDDYRYIRTGEFGYNFLNFTNTTSKENE
jgi:hypothetical protein